LIGSVFQSRYTVNGFLAEGPVFTLYSARDKLTSKDVSLRLIKPPFDREEQFKLALERAIEKTLTVRSVFIERLIQLETDEERTYVVGDLTRAPSLADRIRKLAPFTPAVAVSCATSIARGLDAFHKAGLVHGDISGDNIALLGDGEIRLQLGGIWEAYSASATAGFSVLPTLAAYLAPEVSNGDLPSASSDLYAVGILLYELLTGRKPYQADTALATAMRHSTEPTPRVRDSNPTTPVVLDEIVYKAMSKDPASRYRTANELIFDLRQTQDAIRFGKTLSWPINGPAPAPAPTSSRKVPVAPKMSAVREPEPPSDRPRREKPDRDVPIWMMLLFASAFGVVIALGLVNFFIGASRARLVTIPDLSRLSFSEAERSLNSMHLRIGTLGTRKPSDKVEVDRVVDSDPPAGQRVTEGTLVHLNLSEGSRQIKVPKLFKLFPDKARSLLSGVNLSLDDTIDKINDPSVPNGQICRQSPDAGSTVARSSKIHVAVSDSSAPVVSKDAKHYIYTLNVALTHILQPVQVRIDMTDDEGTKTIFNETKNPEDSFTITQRGTGSKATFTVYYDGKQVEQKQEDAAESNAPTGQPPSGASSNTDTATPPDQTPADGDSTSTTGDTNSATPDGNSEGNP
jgi:beta-lactam-binding protein with PASTA domain